MTVKTYHETMRKRRAVLAVAAVLLFIGVFSFVYWFIVFPPVWSALAVNGWPPFWFNIYSGVAFLVWAAVVALACFLLWLNRDKIVPVQSAPDPVGVAGSGMNGPEYPTKLARVQPDCVSDTAQQLPVSPHKNRDIELSTAEDLDTTQLGDELSSQDSSSTQSLQTIVPNTLYKKESNPVDITRKVIPAKDNKKKISCTESESSVEAGPVVSSGSQEKVQPVVEKPGVMLRKKPGLKIEIAKEGQGSDDAPLSPRELFFRDLMKKAEEGPARARSQDVEVSLQSRVDGRKSMPASALHSMPTSPPDNTARIVAESPKSVKPAGTRRNSSEEYFIAQVSPTVKNTSEVHMFITNHDSKSSAPAIQWRLVSVSDNLPSGEPPRTGNIDEFIDSERKHSQNTKENEENTTDDSVF